MLQNVGDALKRPTPDLAAPEEAFNPGPVSPPPLLTPGYYRNDSGDRNVPIDHLDGLSPAHVLKISA